MKRRCPVCHKVIRTSGAETTEDARFFPFCSERCKLIDLGKWVSGEYRIPTAFPEEEGEGSSKSDDDSLKK